MKKSIRTKGLWWIIFPAILLPLSHWPQWLYRKCLEVNKIYFLHSKLCGKVWTVDKIFYWVSSSNNRWGRITSFCRIKCQKSFQKDYISFCMLCNTQFSIRFRILMHIRFWIGRYKGCSRKHHNSHSKYLSEFADLVLKWMKSIYFYYMHLT